MATNEKTPSNSQNKTAVKGEAKASAEKEKTYTEAQVQAMIAEAAKKAAADALASVSARGIPAEAENVTIMYIAEVAPDNELELPGYGTMRPGSYLEIPKKEFGGKFMSSLARKLIDKRHIIVTSGLTQAERERWNCDYKEGEVLSERAFDSFLNYPTEKLVEVFNKLCPEHRSFVCCRFITAHEKGDNRVGMEKVKALSAASKTKENPEGMLKPLLEKLAKELAE